MEGRDLPDGWTVWHARPDDIVVLTYRPDVFDGSRFEAACLPTIAIKPERSREGRGRPRAAGTGGPWRVELMLEPDAVVESRRTETREQALEVGERLAAAFADGEIAYRAAYTHPNEAYLERLDELVGCQE